MTETCKLTINGEWLTDYMRSWFWDEDVSFESCLDLIKTSIPDIAATPAADLTAAILEGRKRISEAGEVISEENDENYRPISEKTDYYRKQVLLQQICEDMRSCFINYVDRWAAVKSCHPEALDHAGNPTSYQECLDYFGTVTNTIGEKIRLEDRLSGPSAAGLWLYDCPEFVYHIVHELSCAAGTDEFWRAVYEAKKDDPDFAERTRKYEACLKRKEEKYLYFKSVENAKAKKPEFRYLSRKWFDCKQKETISPDYNMFPDKMSCWTGLISPAGDFFSCSYGGHELKAYYLFAAHPGWFGLEDAEDITDEYLREHDITLDTALDLLINKYGWCATRYIPAIGHYVTEPALPKRVSAAQGKKIDEVAEKYKINFWKMENSNERI
ncbi:MAG: hypothetical protein IJI14_05045 [Anaerolineaceae bacterium]|nr:hypothetical protein [Anaerolineaceae bacterium]